MGLAQNRSSTQKASTHGCLEAWLISTSAAVAHRYDIYELSSYTYYHTFSSQVPRLKWICWWRPFMLFISVRNVYHVSH